MSACTCGRPIRYPTLGQCHACYQRARYWRDPDVRAYAREEALRRYHEKKRPGDQKPFDGRADFWFHGADVQDT